MKRLLLSSVLLVAMGHAAFGFENDAVIQVPPMDPQIIQLDDPLFINNNVFNVSISSFVVSSTTLYETSDTLDYTNNGVMTGTAGFDFENFPASVGQRHMANSFANNGNGLGGGVINAVNSFGGINVFQRSGSFSGLTQAPLNFESSGLAAVIVHATNVVNSGLITTDNTGLIDIVGNSLDMRRGQFVMTGAPTPSSLDFGFGGFGTNSSGWQPTNQLTETSSTTPIFTNSAGNQLQFSLASTAYFENTNPTPDANGNLLWRIIFLEDDSPPNVTHSVSFDPAGGGFGAFHIQWAGTFRDPRTGLTDTNYFMMSDEPVDRRQRVNPFLVNNGIPAEFTFTQGSFPLLPGTPVDPSFVETPFPPAATNDFAYVQIVPQPLSLGTNQIVGGNPTNLPGRIQLTSSGALDLTDTTISGPNYLKLSAPVNFIGNSNSVVSAAYADLNLGSASGSLVLSNLLVPELPAWTVSGGGSFGGGFGAGIEAFSASYLFVVTNTITNLVAGTTNTVSVTNDVRILMVRSTLQPTAPASQKDVALHAANVQISDVYNIFGSFFSDATSLTVATNGSSAYSPAGALTLNSPNLVWGASLPNLQYLTNWGSISTVNLANFADNMPGLLSPRSQATPYQAFVNHGSITDQGAFIYANYFANSGTLQESPNGDLTLKIGGSVISTNSSMRAPNGPVSISANSILISNSVVEAGRALTFNASCFVSDGYALGNQFGHATNATLPTVVAGGNTFLASGGVQFGANPASGDLLGTTIGDFADTNLLSINVWPGADRGASPSGFAENTALGRLFLIADANPSHFDFRGLNNNNALYVDLLDFEDYATNTDANGNYTAVTIEPGMKIYYAQALVNGISVAEKLNGKNGGGFQWVSNYAGVYSSTNLSGTLYNEALAISTHIDSDGDTVVNANDPTPFPAGFTFDISNSGPIACGGGGNPPGTDPTQEPTNNYSRTPGTLSFPAQQSGSTSVSFSKAQGSYNGLFYETNGVKASSAGFFSAKLTGKGAFSGKLQLGAGTYSFSKAFNHSGNCVVSAVDKKLGTLTLTLHLVNNDEIVGEVSSGTAWTAQLLAFSSVKNASTYGVGKHSLVLSANADNSTTVSGDSYGSMTLNKNGNIQWTGALPDGSKVSQNSVLSKDGVWPLYSSLYGGNGSLIGWLQLTNGSSDVGGSAVWVAPANATGLYPNGVTNELDATGSDVTPSAGVSQNTLILSSPQLTAPLTNNVSISGKTGQSGNNTLSLSVDAKNGLFNGSVFDPGSGQQLSFQGALLEKSGVGGGFFLNADKSLGGKVSLSPAN